MPSSLAREIVYTRNDKFLQNLRESLRYGFVGRKYVEYYGGGRQHQQFKEQLSKG